MTAAKACWQQHQQRNIISRENCGEETRESFSWQQ
jgi:hypothetical protein